MLDVLLSEILISLNLVFSRPANSYLDLSNYPNLSLELEKEVQGEDEEQIKEPEIKKTTTQPSPVKAVKPQLETSVVPPKINSPPDLSTLFSKYSQEYGVDQELLMRIARCESGFNPGAVNGFYGGLYQFTPQACASTRGAMGLDINPELRFNPEEAIKTAAFKIACGGINAWPNCR